MNGLVKHGALAIALVLMVTVTHTFFVYGQIDEAFENSNDVQDSSAIGFDPVGQVMGAAGAGEPAYTFQMDNAEFNIVDPAGGWDVVGTPQKIEEIRNSDGDNNKYAMVDDYFTLQDSTGNKLEFALTSSDFWQSALFESDKGVISFSSPEALDAAFTFKTSSETGNPALEYEKNGVKTTVGYGEKGNINALTVSGKNADGSAYEHAIGISGATTDSFSGVQMEFSKEGAPNIQFSNSDYKANSRFSLTAQGDQLILQDNSDNSQTAIPYQDNEHGTLQSVNFKKDETLDLIYEKNGEQKTAGLEEFHPDAAVLTLDQEIDKVANVEVWDYPGEGYEIIDGWKDKPEQTSEIVNRLAQRLDPAESTPDQLYNIANAIGVFFAAMGPQERVNMAKTVEQPLISLLDNNPDERVRERAVSGLGYCVLTGDKAVSDAFERALQNDSSVAVRILAAHNKGHMAINTGIDKLF